MKDRATTRALITSALGLVASAAWAQPMPADSVSPVPPSDTTPADATQAPTTPVATSSEALSKDSTGPSEVLSDIVVTARKRTERLQDVPVAVSAVRGDALTTQGAIDVQDVSRVAPGLFYQSIEPSRPNIYLRGIGTRSFDAGAESSVGTFVDGVYIGRFGGQIASLVGVDRVEVLKGPQGALFGRNTIGGAINIATKKPGDDFEARVTGTYNRQSHFDADGGGATAIVSGPLVEGKLAALVSGGYNHDDGDMLATNTGRRYNGQTSKTARARLVWKAADDIEFDLAGDYLDTKNSLGFRGSDVEGTRSAILVAKPGLTSPIDPDPYRFTQTSFPGSHDRSGGVGLTSTYSGDTLALTSVTAYRAGRERGDSDLDGTALDTVSNPIAEKSHQFSEELRLSSTSGGALTFDDKVNWLIGAYYYSEHVRRSEGQLIGADSVLTFFSGGPFNNVSNVRVNTRSFALFGQAGVKLTDTLKIDAGLRYSNDSKHAVIGGVTDFPLPFLVPANFQVTPHKTFSSVDPSVTLSYKPTPAILAYASYSKGFKSGAFQYVAFTPALASRIVDPEKLNAYQVGAKTEFFDHHLRINGAAFYYDYKNIQVPRIEIPAGGSVPAVTLSNAARSHIKGFEVEGVGVFNRYFRIEYGYAFLDAKFKKYVYSPTLDFSGNALPRAPRNTLDLAGVVTVPVGGDTLEVRGAMNYVSSLYFEPDNAKVDPGTREPARTLFDASATYTHGGYSLTIWGRNLSDKGYRSSVLNISGSRLDEVWARRRVVGVTLAAAFR